MKILILSRYDTLGASSRLRSFQYLPYLREKGLSIDVSPLFSNGYIETLYESGTSLREVISAYSRRFLKVLTAFSYDLLIIEKELFPFMPAIFERMLTLCGVPYIVDYDDALFHRYDSHKSSLVRFFLASKIDTVMKTADTVIAGNKYLAERAKKSGAKNVVIIPTVVDIKRYVPVVPPYTNEVKIVGWIGTPKTSHYLLPLLPIFEFLKLRMNVKFVAIGANKKDFLDSSVEVWPWSETTEVELIQRLDIGIMPLKDSPWERGKCGYKLIQYMACGLPVVASAIGVNNEIVQDGNNGFLVRTEREWGSILSRLILDDELRKRLGCAGRSLIETKYSRQSQQQQLLAVISGAMERNK